MTATGHAVVGAAIAAKIPDPLIAVPLAIASHFLCDLLPHWDTGTHWRTKGMKRVFFETLFDVFGGYALVFLIFIMYLHADPISIYTGVIAAQLPDFMEFPYFFLHWKVPPFTWVNDIQHFFHRRMDKPWGILNQVFVASVFLLWVLV